MSSSEIDHEQNYVAALYERVDLLRAQASARLTGTLGQAGGTAQATLERDVAIARYTERLARFDAAEDGLCFGRIDLKDGTRHHIGRLGLLDESAEGEPLLLDWRAPAARPFYVATAGAPHGVSRRRHITTHGRRVIGLDDEVLDREGLADAGGLTGEAALLAAVEAGRTGRMRDIVATLQAEQDEIIRSAHRRILVVQGGPGTGKTAVALHRAAYLLYTHRHLATRGVLVVGPNATFLTYIGQVLPGLGETNVLLSTVAELFPGVTANRPEPPAVAEIKGRAAMAEVLAAAVRDRQVPGAIEIGYAGETLLLDRRTLLRAAERTRSTRLPHNLARPIFQREIVAELARQLTDATRRLTERMEAEVADALAGAEAGIAADLASLPAESAPELGPESDDVDLRPELWADPDVRAAIEGLWPALTPQRLLADLFADQDRLASAAPGLSPAERASLVRAPGGWSVADVPLLDEAAELLGHDDRAAGSREARERAQRIAYAQGVLDIAAGSRSSDAVLAAGDMMDAERLADRHEERDHRTVAERAAADRTWAFGHVIVDEAQELSEMAWRLLMRRCPSRSMTIVGDVAQTGSAAGTTSWSRVLGPHVGDRWRLARLSVNYRTPAEVMAATADLLTAIHPGQEPPRSVRETGVPPWRLTAPALPETLAEVTAREAESLEDGRLAVIVPESRIDSLGAAISRVVPVAYGAEPDLTSPVVLLGVGQAKGLEFDSVLIADPGGILAESPRGRNDLYVAMTRSTQRLGILHAEPVPAEIAAVPVLGK